MRLKIFSNVRYLAEGIGHVVMLYPFWGKNPEDPRAPESGRFDRYVEVGGSLFEMTSLSRADLAVMPADWGHVHQNESAQDLAAELAQQTKQAGKQLVVFFWSDSDEEIPLKDAVVFRTSFYGSARRANEFAMPAWSEDFVVKHLGGRLPIRVKATKPVVGFCGLASTSEVPLTPRAGGILRRAASLIGAGKEDGSARPNLGHMIRAEAMRVLSKSPAVNTNFLVRDRFLGGALLQDGRVDLDLKRSVRQEYLTNMVGSDYVLCARGAGNFSYRLYESLCCGRIPVLIDTDCVLPYDFAVEWKDYCVWLEESDLPLIAERVGEFHDNLSPQDFLDLQQECRRFWEQWLSPEGFFANLFRHFRDTPPYEG